MVRSRPGEIDGIAFRLTTSLFFDRGTAADIQMMHELAQKRPFLAPHLEYALQFKEQKKPPAASASVPGSSARAASSEDSAVMPPPGPEQASPSAAIHTELTRPKGPWLAIGTLAALIVAAWAWWRLGK